MSDEPFEIISDETIELLDENNENILLRMTRIQSKLNRDVYDIVFNSKSRFYLIGHIKPNKTPKLENFYYSSFFGLSLDSYLVHNIADSLRSCYSVQKFETIYNHLYDNFDEY